MALQDRHRTISGAFTPAWDLRQRRFSGLAEGGASIQRQRTSQA
jgi:hypothetical protein